MALLFEAVKTSIVAPSAAMLVSVAGLAYR